MDSIDLGQKRFTNCEAVKQAVEQYNSQSDSVKMFVDENERITKLINLEHYLKTG